MAKPSAGDYTGKQKARLMQEAQQQQVEQAQRVAMATVVAEREATTEVVDYTAEEEAPVPDTGPVDLTVQPADEEPDETIEQLVSRVGGAPSPDAVAGPVDLVEETETSSPPEPPVIVEKTKTLIRARYDLDNVTVGRGTNYSFEEGRQYYVPPHVAEHLAERDYVDVLR